MLRRSSLVLSRGIRSGRASAAGRALSLRLASSTSAFSTLSVNSKFTAVASRGLSIAAASSSPSSAAPIKTRRLGGELAAYGVDAKWVFQKRHEGIRIMTVKDAQEELAREKAAKIEALGLENEDLTALDKTLENLGISLDFLLAKQQKEGITFSNIGDIKRLYERLLTACQTTDNAGGDWNSLPAALLALGVTPDWLIQLKKEGATYSSPDDIYNLVLARAGLTSQGRDAVEKTLVENGLTWNWLVSQPAAFENQQQFENAIAEAKSRQVRAESFRLTELLNLDVPAAGRAKTVVEMTEAIKKAGFGLEWALDLHRSGVRFAEVEDVIAAVYSTWATQASMTEVEIAHLIDKLDAVGIDFDFLAAAGNAPALLRTVRTVLDWLLDLAAEDKCDFYTRKELEDLIADVRLQKLSAAGLTHLDVDKAQKELETINSTWQWLIETKEAGTVIDSIEDIRKAFAAYLVEFERRCFAVFGMVGDRADLEFNMRQMGVTFDWIDEMKAKGHEINNMEDVEELLEVLGGSSEELTSRQKLLRIGFFAETDAEAEAAIETLRLQGVEIDGLVESVESGKFNRPEETGLDFLSKLKQHVRPLPAENANLPQFAAASTPKCSLGGKKAGKFDVFDLELMSCFISETGKMQRRASNRTCAKKQRELAKKIKLARHIGLLPHLAKHPYYARMTKNYFIGERLSAGLKPNEPSPKSNLPDVSPWWQNTKTKDPWAKFFL